MKLDMRFDAAGNPEDYDVDERKALLEAIARAVGFSSAPAGSTITIAAASVSITASFPVIDVADADAHIATASAYSTPNAFSAAINGQLAAAGATVSIDGTGGSSFAATSTATSIASPLRASSGGNLVADWIAPSSLVPLWGVLFSHLSLAAGAQRARV